MLSVKTIREAANTIFNVLRINHSPILLHYTIINNKTYSIVEIFRYYFMRIEVVMSVSKYHVSMFLSV